MDFPQYQLPGLGHGMTIGLNAVVHVILSHGIAIGVFLFIAISELIGYRRRSEAWNKFAHDAIVPTAVVISSFSAITGVGIWFTIGPLAPRAASAMLRIFFWPWFLEWIVFVSEALILLIYYLAWPKMEATDFRKRLHIGLGFSYTVGGLLSAFLITGIIGYQLTPGQWLWEPSRWVAFFNPSVWPQTFVRFFGGIALGAILISAFVLFRKHHRELRPAALRVFGSGLLIAGFLTGLSFLWYRQNIPPTFKINTAFAILTSHLSQHLWVFWLLLIAALALVLLLALLNLARLDNAARLAVVPALLAAFALVAGFERMREFIRGPYVMSSYMYASEITAAETAAFRHRGLLPQLYWHNSVSESPSGFEGPGKALFDHSCSTCHTLGGLNDIRQRFQGRTPDGVYAILGHTSQLVPWMPPFAGNDRERRLLAAFIYDQSRELAPRPSAQKEAQNK